MVGHYGIYIIKNSLVKEKSNSKLPILILCSFKKIDNFRKYSFSVHGVYGTEGNYEIKGLWLWRGLDVAPQMKEHEAFEFFNVKKLSPESVADRGLVENYWLHINEGDVVEGLPVVEVIYFR